MPSRYLAPGRKPMRLRSGSACDFPHFDSPRQQGIRYQGAMTAPGNGFGTHDCDPFRPRQFYQIGQLLPEFGRLYIVGKAAETGVMPAGVERIPACAPEAAQSRHIPVMKTGGMQGG